MLYAHVRAFCDKLLCVLSSFALHFPSFPFWFLPVILTDRSGAVLLLWILFVIYIHTRSVMCVPSSRVITCWEMG